jgi:hypothetical protein
VLDRSSRRDLTRMAVRRIAALAFLCSAIYIVAVRYEKLAHIAALLGRFLPRLGAVQSF